LQSLNKIKRKYLLLLLRIGSIAILAMNIMTITSSYKITAQISSLSPQQQQSVLQDKYIDISTREDAQIGLDVPEIEVGKNPVDVAVDPEANRVYVANEGSDSISVLDSSTYEVVANITEGN
jgi:YVTN family beta-propeller protein